MSPRRIWTLTLAMVSLGILLAVGLYSWALWWLHEHCASQGDPLCKVLTSSPPWIVLTGVAAAPAVVLTWVWRTNHKETDIRDKAEELRQGQEEQQRQRETYLLDAYMRAVDAVASTELSRQLAGFALLAQVGRESPQFRGSVLETITAFMRANARASEKQAQLELRSSALIIAAVRALGAIPKEGVPRVDLSGVLLHRVSLQGGDFRSVIFDSSRLHLLEFADSDLRGASFADVQTGILTFLRCDCREASFARAYLECLKTEGTPYQQADFDGAVVQLPDEELVNEKPSDTFRGAYQTTKTRVQFNAHPIVKPENTGMVPKPERRQLHAEQAERD